MENAPQEIRFQKRLVDFGLSPKGRVLRDRMSCVGFRLGRTRHYTWTIFRTLLGGEDEFIKEVPTLPAVEEWVVEYENRRFARADAIPPRP
jgi:hypothetical protein